MKKLGFLLLLVVVAMLGGTALAQGDNSVYFTTYFSMASRIGPCTIYDGRSQRSSQNLQVAPHVVERLLNRNLEASRTRQMAS